VEYVFTEKAPRPVGPYSQAVRVGAWLFISGQIPIDPATGQIIKGDFKRASRQVLENIKAIVEAAGGILEDVVKVTVYMKDISKFSEFNEVYSEYFSKHKPARAVVGISKLPKDAELEVEAVAYLRKTRNEMMK